MQKTDFRKKNIESKKENHIFSTYSIPNTAVVIILKHKPRHSLVQNSLTLTKSQSFYKWPRRTLRG